MSFRLQDYDYPFNSDLIATQPCEPRDSSRLMVLHRKEQRWEHRKFTDLPDYLHQGDLLLANNTRVIRARLLGNRVAQEKAENVIGGKVEFLLLREIEPLVWEGLFHASAKHRRGLRFEIPIESSHPLKGELIKGASEAEEGTVVARFDRDPARSGAGQMPLPQYILYKRTGSAWADPTSNLPQDETDYQTVYSKDAGSAAAPTAGFHFSNALLDRIQSKKVSWQELTLHVGLGTFRPVKERDIRKHKMHRESYEIPASVAEELNQAKEKKQRIIAVGTTSLRAVESAWDATSGNVRSGAFETEIFLYPGGPGFQVVSGLITNFHLPRSTLLMLVCAFAGREFVLSAYEEAVRERYRFYTYGDGMLVI